ncbi:hypothetical protein AK812_SmicGene13483 [Symbiodinium microadriaticum]|uniref:Uncharacterized protein n=1 Tax=Symbiodinium microadriaticum TaxID=2951 RepID=A0A1Q9E7Z9_SYMMI|nr:hypothetical protein AK812_SmicGene13483 [Symbiodinium microadriaticum]
METIGTWLSKKGTTMETIGSIPAKELCPGTIRDSYWEEMVRLTLAPGVQSAFALLLAVDQLPGTEDGLRLLSARLEASGRWDAAVQLWRLAAPWRMTGSCSEEFGTAIRLRRAKASAAQMPRFRASAAQRCYLPLGYSVNVMGKLGGAAQRRMGWQAELGTVMVVYEVSFLPSGAEQLVGSAIDRSAFSCFRARCALTCAPTCT